MATIQERQSSDGKVRQTLILSSPLTAEGLERRRFPYNGRDALRGFRALARAFWEKVSVTAMRHVSVLVCMCLLSSCTPATIEHSVGPACDPQESVYVVSHGWHAGIVVSRLDLLNFVPSLEKDFTSGEYLEIGWGDEQFYRAQTPTAGLAIRAVLWPTSTVIHVVAVPKSPRMQFSESEVIEISVPRAGYEQQLAYVAESFSTTPDKSIAGLGPGLYGDGWFYRAEGTFHAFNTCNTWVAKAIGRTGYPMRDQTVITVEPLLSQLRDSMDENLPCYSAR